MNEDSDVNIDVSEHILIDYVGHLTSREYLDTAEITVGVI